MENRTIRAISAFTAFVGSMKVFNHAVVDGSGKVIAKATVDTLPAKVAQDYVDAGMAEYVDIKPARVAGTSPTPTPAPAPAGGFVATYKPVGMYVITGPGLDEPEIFKGNKAGADERIAELRATATTTRSDDAPAD